METEETISLQLRKLALEIADLERPWWKRPGYILAALPTLLAIVALAVGIFNGFFSAQLTKLENQRHDLQAEVKEFETKRNSLSSQNQELQTEISTKQHSLNEIDELRSRLNVVTFELANIDTPRARTISVDAAGRDPVKEPETPDQARERKVKERMDAVSELSTIATKLKEILTQAGVDNTAQATAEIQRANASIRVDPQPATTKRLPKRRK